MEFKAQFEQYLELMKNKDPDLQTFGARSHGYRFGPKLDESQISSFEEANDCKLPETYKVYLTEFGNGGAGPSYGVFELGHMDDGFGHAPWASYIKPNLKFRFTEGFNNDYILYDGEPQEDDFENRKAYNKAYELWERENGMERMNQYYDEHGLYEGAIPICHHGCAHRSWLVVDPDHQEFGNVWQCYLADNMGVEPAEKPDGSRMNFGDWVLDWCSDAIEKLESSN